MLHHVHVSLHDSGTGTVDTASTPGLSKMSSGRVLLTVHNRTTAVQTCVLEDAADATVLTFTAIPVDRSQTKGFDATPQDYKIEDNAGTDRLTLTALNPQTRYAPTSAKDAIITTVVKAVGADVTVTSPAGITDHAGTHTESYKWQSAPSPYAEGDFVDCTVDGATSVTDPTKYTVQAADVTHKVRLITTATSTTEGTLVSRSNVSGICTA